MESQGIETNSIVNTQAKTISKAKVEPNSSTLAISTFTKPKTNKNQHITSQTSESKLVASNSTTKNSLFTNKPLSGSKTTTSFTGSNSPNSSLNRANVFFDTDDNFYDQSPKEEFVHLTLLTHKVLMNEPLSENLTKKNNNTKIKFVPFTFRLSAGYRFGNVLNTSGLNRNINYTANQFNIDLSAEYMFNSHWGVQSGITFARTNETQRYQGLSIEDNSFTDYQDNSHWNYFDQEITVVDQTWWLGGWWVYGTSTDTIVDSNYVTQIDSNFITQFDSTQTEFTENHKVSQIEIPVLLTYSFVVNRWTFQVATGASFGLFLNSSGRIVRFNEDAIGGIETSKGLFNSMQYNYLLSTEAGFGLNEHWRITVRPQLKVNLNSMFNSSNTYSQKYIYYGVNVGMAFNF